MDITSRRQDTVEVATGFAEIVSDDFPVLHGVGLGDVLNSMSRKSLSVGDAVGFTGGLGFSVLATGTFPHAPRFAALASFSSSMQMCEICPRIATIRQRCSRPVNSRESRAHK
jgi:hypothetical protein